MARAQVAAMAAGGPGPGPSGPGNSTGRSRESSASMWAPPLPIAVGGVASGHGAMRAYGMHSDGAAAAVANAAVAVAGPHAAAVNMPVGPGLHSGGSRGSRGHSRHASYDSIDVNSRDGDGVSQRGNSGGVGGGAAVDARATPFVLYGGGAAATAPPPPAPLQRIAADPTSDLLQQNLQLQRELELLRQQVALFTQPSVTGRVAGSLAAVAGPGAPPGPMSAPPSSNRHKRSASIDVSSLIATRDGIGPAKDYLAPAASQSPAAASHAPQGHLSPERRSPLARDGGTGTGTGTGNFMMGHKTAPPALEALRQNHPGMSLAQAGVYITLKPPAQKGGPVRLVKVRFNRKMFTEQSQGQAWWNMHRATLVAMYELTFDMGNKQFGSGGSGSAGGVGVGVGGDGGGGGGGPLYPATATALATTAAAAAAQPYYPSHQRAQSGGGSSGRS
ncbi:hypothetical protein VOLCADRAFT_99809 [Volvox carteri f. nagariensis]|uniref:BRX domain-containing protein n=1 Tax=Volvox carteri f. nagariensis TaxID=3068 RepID=D8UIQ0_VOLCA|nr:uncharacterized protein VOLCADRAFT_99809 [Volvox carteri f. nagariensis]EFJ40393.1 hypothetical protein VOLCADRAFT_99809 [Volvox carteri f. nagariensis]|eukprot:XP_002958544.1 hypothetical protein VOLCADRAFT_99809 [Volvox carteri f. nagariensis]